MRYADIVLPLAQPLYTFAVAEGVTLCEGMAVVVPFGRSKIYTGIVWRLHDRRPDFKTVKTVSRVLYGTPLLDERQRRFWEWVADYYMCTLGEVMRVALPSLMKPSGHGEEEFAADEFRPRREWFVALAGEALTADGLAAALERMGRRAPRQREALEELAALAPDGAEVARSRLAADRTALALLVKKGLLTCIEREVAPGPVTGGAQFRLPTLSAGQRKAAEEIRAVFADRATVLLRGVTGSGKTEIYMHFAAEVLARGGQVLLLVPEIALTAQLVDRLRQVFGERVIAYHSKLTDRKRTELYLRLRDSAGGELVIGARSAIFLPLRRLELVVVDEEHDPSYKQTDPAPRYQARDCAVLMTRLLGCRTLLGSATPSLESYLNAATGKYGSVVLAERYGPSRMPQILVSDTIRAVKRVYGEASGDVNHTFEPKDICEIAEGKRPGDVEAAKKAFAEMGEIAGDAMATAVTLVDGLIVIGGGITAARKCIMPSLLNELRSKMHQLNGNELNRVQMKVYDLDDETEFREFAKGAQRPLKVYGTDRYVAYDPQKRIGVTISKLGASQAISVGAYAFALSQLDTENA